MVNMLKKSLLAASFFAAATAQAEAPIAQYGEFQIEVIKAGKTLYTASTVLGPNGNTVMEDGIRTLPMEASCSRNVTISPPLTFKKGVALELSANIHNNVAYGMFGWVVEAPSPAAPEAPFGHGCKARMVVGHHYGTSGGQILKVGEPSVTRIDDMTVKLTLKQVFNTAPENTAVGKLQSF